jgi:GNAT superfamily N-acetyltransferase
MAIEIRKAVPEDFEQVYSLIKEFATFIKTPEKVVVTPDQMLEDKDYFQSYIAINGGQVIAFATYFIAYYSWTGKTVYLDDLYVLDEYRGNGIGTLLFNKVIETAKTEKCKKLRWQVSNWNSKAIEFYKKMGAAIDEVEINCDLLLNQEV